MAVAPLCVHSERKTDRARRDIWGGWPTPTCGHLLLFVPSDRKTDRARREKGRWAANSYMWPLMCPFLKERQTGLGKTYGVDCQLIHVAIHSFLSLLKESQTGLEEREGWVGDQLLHVPPFVPLLEERQTGLGDAYGLDGQLLHVALYSFLILLSERQTGLGEREGEVGGQLLQVAPFCVPSGKDRQG